MVVVVGCQVSSQSITPTKPKKQTTKNTHKSKVVQGCFKICNSSPPPHSKNLKAFEKREREREGVCVKHYRLVLMKEEEEHRNSQTQMAS